MYFNKNHYDWKRIDGNSLRQVVVTGEGLMNVWTRFEKALSSEAEIPYHRHTHVQTAIVIKGSFKFSVKDENDHSEIQIVHEGDAIYFPSNHWHGCIPLEDESLLLDSFTPIREEFLTVEGL